MIRIEGFVLLPAFQTNTWLLFDDESMEAMIIDPSAPSHTLLNRIKEKGLKVLGIINTHGHGDHIGGNKFFSEHLTCELAIHIEDEQMLINNKLNLSSYIGEDITPFPATKLLSGDDVLMLGKNRLQIIHTPGHTKGSICILCEKILLSGDTLFELSIGRTDLPGGCHESIIHSIKSKLFMLSDDVVVFPGHGSRTAIGIEKLNNPFVR